MKMQPTKAGRHDRLAGTTGQVKRGQNAAGIQTALAFGDPSEHLGAKRGFFFGNDPKTATRS